MAVMDKVKTFLTGREPAAQLAAIEAEIVARQAESEQLSGGRPGAVLLAMQGDNDARARVDKIDEEVAALDARLRDLRQGASEARRLIAARQDAALRREAAERPPRIAALVAERLQMAAEIHEAARAIADKTQAMKRNADELCDLVASDGVRQSFGFGAFTSRLRSALTPLFQIQTSRPHEAKGNLLGLASDWIGARYWLTLSEVEQELCDGLARYWLTEADATEAKARLEAKGEKTIVTPIAGGCFTIVGVEHAFGDRAAAEAAANGKPLAILAHAGGWLLVPERFAGAQA